AAKMYGLNLIPAKAYLLPFGLLPTEKNLQGTAGGNLVVRATPATAATPTQPAEAGTLAATLQLQDLRLAADSESAASVGSITVDAPALLDKVIHVNAIHVDDVRITASRTHDGRLRFAGIEVVPVPAQATPAPTAATQPAVASAGSAPAVDLDLLAVTRTRLAFIDNAFDAPNELSLDVPTLELKHLSTDPAMASHPATLKLAAAAPKLARSIDVDGTLNLAGPKKSVDLSVKVTGIRPAAAAVYLEPLGIHSNLRDADLSCHLAGSVEMPAGGAVRVSANLQNVQVRDQGQTLFAMPKVDLEQATLNPGDGRISVDTIAIDGPTLPISRDAAGLKLLGFTYAPVAKTAAAPAVKTPAPTSAPAARSGQGLQLPAVALNRLSWRNADLHFDDRAGEQPVSLAVQHVSLDANGLVFDSKADVPPGTFSASLAAPGLVEKISVQGHIAPKADAITFDVAGQADDLTAERLKPLLRSIGIEPQYRGATLKFAASGSAHQQDGALAANFGLQECSLSDGGRPWAALGGLQVDHASIDGHSLSIDSVRVASPMLRAERDADGMLTIAGIKLVPAPAGPVVAAAPAKATTAPTRLDLSLPIAVRVGSVHVEHATLGLHDEAVFPAADLSATASLRAERLVAGTDAPPSPFSVTLSSPGVVRDLQIDGTLLTAPKHQALTLDLTGAGISGRALEPYLPPNVNMTLKDGAVAAKVSASIEPTEAGGSSTSFALTDASFTDGAGGRPLGAVGALRLDVSRVDLAANVIDIKQATLEHATLAVKQDDAGITILGTQLAAKPQRPARPVRETLESAATTQTSDIAAITSLARQKPPLIRIETLALGADQLRIDSNQLSQPLVIADASLKSTGPIELLGDRPTERRPFDVVARAAVEGAIDSIGLNAHLAPFAGEPNAKLALDVNGIHAADLLHRVPQAAKWVSGDDLNNGRFTATLDAQLGFSRRGLFGIDLTRDITGRFDVNHVALTNAGNPKPLAGVDGVHGEGLRYSPNSGSISLKSLEITKPAARIVRDTAGIHALGLTLKTPPPATQPATQPVVAAPTPRPIEVTPSSAPAPSAGAEARIDRLTISGIDLTLEDDVGKPKTVIPITQLDVDVKGLSTAALTQPNKPVRFSAIVGAGKVDLPPRKGADRTKLQPREVFSEASASGTVTLAPKPNGYVKASISGLEMTAIRGLASEYGITLGGGTFDGRIDARMNGSDSFVAHVYPTFNELRLKEVPNGPIQSIFRLPAPPDVVISTLEDADGSISFPVNVPLNAGKLDTGAVIGSAVGAVGKVVTEAMVAAPLKAAKLVAMLGGADMSSDRLKGLEPVTIDYAPGESQLTPAEEAALKPVIALMKDDPTIQVTLQHTLGAADVALAEQRANPLSEDSRALAENLRQRKFDLQREVAQASVALRVALATEDAKSQAAAADTLRAAATRLKENGDELDQVLDLLRPGAQRQADRRTRTVAILLGDMRMRAVRDALLQSGVPGIANRLRQANALYNPGDDQKPGEVTLVLTREAKS
ncbi:MAG: DUF748 domain-containing protein, partial [Tepidisphaeraceae bacterium]